MRETQHGENDSPIALLSSYLKSESFDRKNTLVLIPRYSYHSSMLEGIIDQNKVDFRTYEQVDLINGLVIRYFRETGKFPNQVKIIGSYMPIDHTNWDWEAYIKYLGNS